jgi:hypothetical protein
VGDSSSRRVKPRAQMQRGSGAWVKTIQAEYAEHPSYSSPPTAHGNWHTCEDRIILLSTFKTAYLSVCLYICKGSVNLVRAMHHGACWAASDSPVLLGPVLLPSAAP